MKFQRHGGKKKIDAGKALPRYYSHEYATVLPRYSSHERATQDCTESFGGAELDNENSEASDEKALIPARFAQTLLQK